MAKEVNGATLVTITDGSGTVDTIETNGYTGLVALAPGHISTDNSTNENLVGDDDFTGDWEDITNFGVIIVSVTSDVISAIDGLMVQFSTDGTVNGIISDDEFTIFAGAKKTFSFQAAAKYYRIIYTNGSSTQSNFNLQVILKPYYVKPSSHRISNVISTEDDAELVTNVNKGQSDLTGNFENINTFRNALKVDTALVHYVGISEHAKRNLGASTTLDVAANSGDVLINVADTTGFTVGDLIIIHNTTVIERSHFHITAIDTDVSLTLSRPLDNDFEIGDTVQEVEIGMNVNGSLSSPISYKFQPPISERWQITRILITFLDQSPMDDAKFGGINALTNGVIIRIIRNGETQTLTHWLSNSDLKDDMYDVVYADKAPSGFYGLSGRWTFTKAGFVADLDGANGDYLEVLIQDDLTDLDDFEIKGQGRLFGG